MFKIDCICVLNKYGAFGHLMKQPKPSFNQIKWNHGDTHEKKGKKTNFYCSFFTCLSIGYCFVLIISSLNKTAAINQLWIITCQCFHKPTCHLGHLFIVRGDFNFSKSMAIIFNKNFPINLDLIHMIFIADRGKYRISIRMHLWKIESKLHLRCAICGSFNGNRGKWLHEHLFMYTC